MNSKFRILWFENDSGWYSAERKKLSHGLEDHRLLLEDKRETCLDFDLSIIKNNTYDLILMDYMLAAGSTGEQIVKLIRDDSVLTDVLLYSSQYDDMIKACFQISPPMDGVYYADRKNDLFEQKLYRIVDKIVMRSEDIINLRGFVMDNVSDFEARMQSLLEDVWERLEDQREKILECTQNLLKGKQGRLAGEVESFIKNEKDFLKMIKAPYPLTAADRAQLIQALIESMVDNEVLNIPDEFPELKKFSASYSKDIAEYRNQLGHCKEGETIIIIRGKEISIDQDLHRLLREKIIRYDSIIHYLEEQVQSF